jgi:hypothetical protein
MIPNFSVSVEDHALIDKIVERLRAFHIKEGLTFNALTWGMDLTACHANYQLRLKDLLEAKDGDFYHDTFGIAHHIERRRPDAGKLRNCFFPRYATKEAA